MSIKVIHMAPLGTGGITRLTLSINKELDPDTVRFDYLVFREKKEFAEEELGELQAKKQVVDLEHIHNPLIRFYKKMRGMIALFKREQYDVVHVDASTPYDVIVAVAARLAGIDTIIIHSHNDSYKKGNKFKDILMPFFKSLMPYVCTDYFAISEPAAMFMFPASVLNSKNYTIIRNAIPVEKYGYIEEKRIDERKKLGYTNENFVIGNIGRFVYQKNHEFMLEVFERIYNEHKEARLLLVGDGELMEKMIRKAEEMNISEAVCFYGPTHHVPDILQAMDAFIFPSRFEGLGIVAIEAQTSGLPVWAAETIPKEAIICDEFKYISGWNPNIWAEAIWNGRTQVPRRSRNKEAIEAGYDIKTVAKNMQDFYVSKAKAECYGD